MEQNKHIEQNGQNGQPEQEHTFKNWMKAAGRKIERWFLKVVSPAMHWFTFKVIFPKKWKKLTKKEIYDIIFKADTPAGKKFDIWLLVAIVLNMLLLVVDSLLSDNSTLTDRIHRNSSWLWFTMKGLEWIFTLAFTVEYYLRIYCQRNAEKRRQYIFSFYGIIDFLSIFPAYLSVIFPATQALSVLRWLSFVKEGSMLMDALKHSAKKILIFMLFVFISAVILGTVMYAVEGERNPLMTSIPKGIYWAVVTLTTVGYGDITPVTPMGQFIAIVVMILGYSIIAVPTGIVAGETLESHKRHRRRARRIKKILDPVTEDDPVAEDDEEEDIKEADDVKDID